MKNKFYNILFPVCLMLVFSAVTNVKAQDTIYYQNFDSAVLVFPSAWAADTANSGWAVDSSIKNVDTVPGASGFQNLVISNDTFLVGIYSLTSKSISTIGYDSISVLWDARVSKHYEDSGSTVSFNYSINGGTTWTPVTYTENTPNAGWLPDNGGQRIKLPADAGNQPSIMFRWIANLQPTPSGTYRIDDFSVEGDTIITSGITEYKNQDIFKVYTDPNKLLHLNFSSSFHLPAASYVVISDITGRTCLRENLTSNDNTYSIADFKTGIYYVRVVAGDLSFVQKVICNN